jgi:hypothetical protein
MNENEIRPRFQRLNATLLLTSMWANALFAAAPAAAPPATPSPVLPRTIAPAAVVDPFLPRAGEARLFGPEQYVRTTGAKDVYNVTFAAPAWMASPFRLHIENGDAVTGQHRVSSATIAVNNATIATQSDFSQQVASLDRNITLAASNAMTVTLASQPASFLRIGIFGTSADRTAPLLRVLAPLAGTTTNDKTPRIVIGYSDPAGASEPAASGVDPSTLVVLLDNVDRTALFTRRSDEASAELATALPDGVHELKVSLRDKAGNPAQALSQFRVDSAAPSIAVTQPVTGAFLANRQPQVVVTFADETAIDPSSLKLLVNGVDVSSAAVKTATDASWTPAAALPTGANTFRASIRDLGGNESTATSTFQIDVQPPQLTISAPLAGAVSGASQVDYAIAYSDDQALDLSSFRLTLDGQPVTATATAAGVTGTTATLADGAHTFAVTIADKAGNPVTRNVAFRVDTDLPSIAVIAPAAGATLNAPSPLIRIGYSDTQGVDRASLKVTINGNDVTPLLTDVTSIDGAESQFQGKLPEGSVAVTAEIRDSGGNIGRTASSFLIDLTQPALAIELPLDRVADPKPAVRVRYSDAGAGIDPLSLRVAIDGTDVSALFTAGDATATGTLVNALPDGTHVVRATVADRAGNPVTATKSFTVDTVSPVVTISQPADNSFVNSATPPMTVTWTDTAGTGLDLTSAHFFIRKGDVETDVTSAFSVTAAGATGTLPPALALSDGTTQLRGVIRDLAGNSGEGRTSFEIDTALPEWKLEAPAPGSYVANATPAIAIALLDDRSGIDVPRFRVSVDGTDRTPLFTVDANNRATWTVPAALALAQGPHTVTVILFDRAGNAAAAVTKTFTVDTIVPIAAVIAPVAGTYLGTTTPLIRVTYGDAIGSGVDPASVRVLVDDVDRTADVTVGAGAAEGTLRTALSEGAHTIAVSVLDWAGNPAIAFAGFTVDVTAPAIAIAQPVAGDFTNAATIAVSGSVTDVAPVTVTVDGLAATLTGTTFRATNVPVAQEGNVTLTAVAIDAAGNRGEARVIVRADRTSPLVQITSPVANAIVKGPAVAVSGTTTDVSPVNVTLNGTAAMVAQNAFTAMIAASDGPLTITARATDAAGNNGTATTSVTVDSTAPVITFTSPAEGKATNQNSISIHGSITDLTAVTLKAGDVVVPVAGNAFSYDAPLAADGPATIVFNAVDAAGNSATKELHVVRDTAAPSLQIATPDADALVANLPLVVRGTVSDATTVTVTVNGTPATLTQEGWEASFATLTEGPQALVVIATDAAGNTTSLTRKLTLDLLAPVVTIATPAAASFTKESTVTITGTVADVSLKSVTAKGVEGTFTATAPNASSFTIAGVPVVDGDNALVVIATDGASRTGQAQVVVTRDAAAPVVTLTAPDQLPLTTPATAVITATDNVALATVRVTLNGVELLKTAQLPFNVTFSAPATAKTGDTLVLLVEATDKAGNITTASKSIKLISAGVVVGQVLADDTGLPVENARVAVAGREVTAATDAKGRYSLPATDASVVLSIAKNDGTSTTVERVVEVVQGTGTLPVDARLTTIATPSFAGAAGGNLTASGITVRIPAGALSQNRSISLTPLSPQGLPNLLPLGWSPIAAFDLRGPDAFLTPASVSFASPAAALAHLAMYKPQVHAWAMVQANLTASGSSMNAALPAPGAYALVVADAAPAAPPLPAIGEVLTGVPMVALPADVVSTGDVTPSTLPPTGGAARGALAVRSATALPSGTVVQAEVTETFTLANGQIASEEKRTEDIVTYRTPAAAGAALAADIPIRPSRSFDANELVEGHVHLDVFAGRETVRGKSGGSQPVTVTNDVATITVAAGSLAEDTAVSVMPSPLSSSAQASGTFQPIAELTVDLSGRTLNTSAELSVAYASGAASDAYFVARVERVQGVPGLTVVSKAQFSSGRVTSAPLAGFPGIRTGGRYIIYRVTAPFGFVTGTTRTAAGMIAALIDVAGVPFPIASTASGAVSAIAPAGAVRFSARVPSSSLTATATVSVLTTQTADVDLLLTGSATTATITPADNATNVSLTVQIDIDATAAISSTTADAAHARLVRAGDGQPVAVRAILSASGRTLSLVPQARLDASTRYRVDVSGLTDVSGAAIVAPASSFTTRSDAPPQYDLTRIVFAMPDANGNIHVSAPAGSLPPGTNVLIVDSGNGIVISFTAGNDGSVSGDFPGTIDDTLLVTVTDPSGNTTNFQRSQFVATDGSGRVAVGPGGGVVTGTGGTEIRLPDGALAKGITFKVESFGPEVYPERPDLDGAVFGGGLRINYSEKVRLKKEGKLVFARPAGAPDGAFYYIYRRLTGPSGRVAFETIDHAFLEGTGPDAKVVTASYPFVGWNDSADSWSVAADTSTIGFGLGTQTAFYMMYTVDALRPGIPTPGVIKGNVSRAKWLPGATEPVYEGVAGIGITTNDAQTTLAQSQDDGTFAIWDPHYSGGPIQVTASVAGSDGAAPMRVTAFEAGPDTTRDRKGVTQYRNVAIANFALPPAAPAPEAPKVEVHVMTLTPALQREEISGIAIANVPVLIGFKFATGVQAEILSAQIAGTELSVVRDLNNPGPASLKMDRIAGDTFMPTQPGRYTVVATAINPLGGHPIDIDYTFLVTAGAGDNLQPLAGAAPDVITAKLNPKNDEEGVPADALIQVVFTEPVTGVQGNLRLERGSTGGAVGIIQSVTPGRMTTNATPATLAYRLSAVGVDAQGRAFAIADLSAQPSTVAVTSVTIEPLGGLDYDTPYNVVLAAGIGDLDKDANGNPLPKYVPPRTIKFHTVKPAGLGKSDESFDSSGLTVIGAHAYVTERTQYLNGFMDVYNLSDVTQPKLVAREAVSGQPLAIDGEEKASSNDGRPAVLVGSGLKFGFYDRDSGTYIGAGPSNVYLVDVSSPSDPRKIAAVSVTPDPGAGTVLRVVMRQRYGFALTYPNGVQTIDLYEAKGLWLEAELDPKAKRDRDIGLVSVGVGFGQSAIHGQTQVVKKSGLHAPMTGMAVGDYLTGQPAQNRTLAYLTGSVPIMVIDPLLAQMIYNEDAASNTHGEITVGSAIALGSSANMKFAVVAGAGRGVIDNQADVPALVSGPTLAVFDLTNPLAPVLAGSIALDRNPTDVKVVGNSALVALNDGTTAAVNLIDPRRPRLAGKAEGTGGRIALTPDGLLVSSASFHAAGELQPGVRTTIFKPTTIIEDVEPILVQADTDRGDVDNPQKLIAKEATRVHVRVIPARTVTTGVLEVFNRHFPNSAGSGGDVVDVRPYTLNFNDKAEADVLLPVGLKYEDTELIAVATANTIPAPLKSLPREIKLGWVKLRVDANNDTKLDRDDDEAKRKNKSWAFWESDPENDVKPNYATFTEVHTARNGEPLPTSDDQLKALTRATKALQDYATIRIHVNQHWWEKKPGSVVALTLRSSQGTDWYLAEKTGPDLDRFSDANEELKQVKALVNPTPNCSTFPIAGECPATSGPVATIPLPNLVVGDYEFLLRCSACPADPGSRTDTKRLEVRLLESLSDSAGTTMDDVSADLRPFQQWVTVANVRQQPASDRPMAEFVPVGGWSPIPTAAKRLTVLVHGFNVDFAGSLGFTKTWSKRLYWTGHPVLRRQGTDWRQADQGGVEVDGAHVITLSWPGNENVVLDAGAGIRFPAAEFRGFESGVAAARFLAMLKNGSPDRTLNVIAHSLGNLVINNALRRPEIGGSHVVDRYIMHDAAVTSDAFIGSEPPLPDTRSTPASWSGYFADNFDRTQIYNTYNHADQVLLVAWTASQVLHKPTGDLFNAITFRTPDGGSEDSLWPEGGNHEGAIREWASLAYMQSAPAGTAGRFVVPGASKNADFGPYAAGANFSDSHSYMANLRFSRVFPGFQTIQGFLSER